MNSSSEKNDRSLSEFHEHLELIKGISLFSGFPSQATKVLSYLFERGTFDSGDVLCEPGEDTGRAYYLLSGKISVYRQKETGKEKFYEFDKGCLVRGLTLFGPSPSLFCLIAEEQTDFLTLQRQQMSKVIEQFPEVRQSIVTSFLRELQKWEKKCLGNVEKKSFANIGITLL